MPTPSRRSRGGFALAAAVALGGCTAVSVSPPLSSMSATPGAYDPAYVPLTSGALRRPHRAVGVFQMTMRGYRWFHEVEVVDDADPRSILYQVARYAREHGAQGVQYLSLVDLKPQTPAEKVGRQLDSAVRIADHVRADRPERIAGEGSETRWAVQGELVVFVDAPGAPSAP